MKKIKKNLSSDKTQILTKNEQIKKIRLQSSKTQSETKILKQN